MSQLRIGFVREAARSVLKKYRIAAPPVDVEAEIAPFSGQ